MSRDAKAPRFSMRGRLADIVPSAERARARAEQANKTGNRLLLMVLVVAYLLQSCSASRPVSSLGLRDKELPTPTKSI